MISDFRSFTGAISLALVLVVSALMASTSWGAPVRVLVIDGQNNHAWAKTSPVMVDQLAKGDRFIVEVSTSPPKGAAADAWGDWRPDFGAHDVILLNYNGELWPEPVRESFLAYVRDGGGVVVIHAANNSFRGWTEYEEMVGLLWRPADWGDRIIVDDEHRILRVPRGEGPGAGHGRRHPYVVTVIDPNHSITQGIPTRWRQCRDELYHGQRGPARDVHLLMVAYSDPATGGTGAHEPMLWWVPYGKGRVVTNVMGHDVEAIDCAGFETLLRRSCEWAATGFVTSAVPDDFPMYDPFEAAENYNFGDDRRALTQVAAEVRRSLMDPARRAAVEQRLIAVLQSDATYACKQFVCRQLWLAGDEASVPVLGRLLRDEELSDMARYALQNNPSEAAGAVLREAMIRTSGRVRVGLINSVGERGDEVAVASLIDLAHAHDAETADAAIAALGKIGTSQAAVYLRRAASPRRPSAARALLRCADRMAAADDTAAAGDIYVGSLAEDEYDAALRSAALFGLSRTDVERAGGICWEILLDPDHPLAAAVVGMIADWPRGEDVTGLAGGLAELPPSARVAVLAALGDRRDPGVREALMVYAASGSDDEQLAAVRSLSGVEGNGELVRLLASIAARDEDALGKAARHALARLVGGKVNEEIMSQARASESADRVVLIESLGRRAAYESLDLLFETARDEDSAVRLASIEAIGALAGPGRYTSAVRLLVEARDSAEREAAEKAVLGIARRVGSAEGRAAPLVGVYLSATPAARVSLLRVLGQVGGATALQRVRASLGSDQDAVRDAAVRALAAWPDDGPLDDLLRLAQTADQKVHQILALRGFIRLIGLDATRDPSQAVALYAAALELSQNAAEKRQVLSGLGSVAHRDALVLARQLESDSEVAAEAAQAVLRIRRLLFSPVASASDRSDDAAHVLDGDRRTAWSTGRNMRPGMWLMLDMGERYEVTGVQLDGRRAREDFPRQFELFIFNDPEQPGEPVASGKVDNPLLRIDLPEPVAGRYLKIVQTGRVNRPWTIDEMAVEFR